MWHLVRKSALAAVAVLVVGAALAVSASEAQAQGIRVAPSTAGMINRNWQVWPGMSLNQYAYNTALMGQAYSYVPPYALGYNPYPQVVNYNYYRPRYRSYYPRAYGYNPYYSGY